MKTIFLVFFLLFAFSTILPSTTSDLDLVYDEDGEPLKNGGTSYYFKPVFIGMVPGGGLKLGKTGDDTCPLTVVQPERQDDHGLPATFSSLVNFPFITVDVNISIRFTNEPDCVPKSSTWHVVEEFPIDWLVKVASEGPAYSFKIEKYEKYGPHDYKLVYCRGSVCADLGIIRRRLVVITEGNPFVFSFKKAIESSAKWDIVG